MSSARPTVFVRLRQTIADGSYPLVTDVFVVVREYTATDFTGDLRDWQLSDDGREAVAASGYVPLP